MRSDIKLWKEWSKVFSGLRGAFSRKSTFLWATIFCAGLSLRAEKTGVTNIVDSFSLLPKAYHSLLRSIQSNAVNLDLLLTLWVETCIQLFKIHTVDGNIVFLGDGVKIPKEGKKMPAVKSMYQSSSSNSKAEFIMGHSIQSLFLAVRTKSEKIAAVPIVSEIHEGIKYSNRDKRTLQSKMVTLVHKVAEKSKYNAVMVGDAYYANKSIINPFKKHGYHLVTRVAANTVAFKPAKPPKVKKRGRPRVKGDKVILRELFHSLDQADGDFQFKCLDLYWPSAKGIVRFVLCCHKEKGKIILLTTKLDMDPMECIKLYESRWLIETGFKASIHDIGTYNYRYWMKNKEKTRRGQTKEYPHKKSAEYRDRLKSKIAAYHHHMALGNIAHGIMMHLSINFTDEVWNSFNGFIRTLRKDIIPSPAIVSKALSSTIWNFLRSRNHQYDWKKLLRKNRCDCYEGDLSMTG